ARSQRPDSRQREQEGRIRADARPGRRRTGDRTLACIDLERASGRRSRRRARRSHRNPHAVNSFTRNETENFMKTLQKSIVLTAGGLLMISAQGCASTPAPQDLLDARSVYQRAQSGPATQYKPDEL